VHIENWKTAGKAGDGFGCLFYSHQWQLHGDLLIKQGEELTSFQNSGVEY
jgi:hypothetical protein